MNASLTCQPSEQLADGVMIKQIDDLCFVHFAGCSVNAAQTRLVGQRLIAFLERAGCRKLVMSFEGVERMYGFALDNPPLKRPPAWTEKECALPARRVAAGSDVWIG
jgi:hypothetical protein